MGNLIENIFGIRSGPYKRYMRMMYWMNKFKNLTPWPLPYHLPNEAKELAKLAIERITSIDRLSEITEFDCSDIEESIDKTWIISGNAQKNDVLITNLGLAHMFYLGQSPTQKAIIQGLPKTQALYVEGAFRVWLQKVQA